MTWRDERLVDRIREPVGAEPLLTEQRIVRRAGVPDQRQHGGGDEWAGRCTDPRGPCQVGTPHRHDRRRADADRYAVHGWVHLDAEHVRTKRQLEKLIEIGVSVARSLPPKHPTQR
jgi:hypothetical protein